MKLGAAHRLLATSGIEKLREFAESLTADQRQYLLLGLPRALAWGWFGQDFERNLKTPKIVLEGSTEVPAAVYGATEYQRFIVGMLHIRNIFPPHTQSGTIHRLTAVKEKPQEEVAVFKNAEQFRSLTSWTLLPNPVVEDRERPKATTDIILSYKLPSSKNVLFDYLSAYEFLSTINNDIDFYKKYTKESPTFFKNSSRGNLREVEAYLHEKEVALYLNAEQEIKCTWKPVNSSEPALRPSRW